MARLIHAFAGEGRGHLSRALALAAALRARGHEVRLCCGGSAAAALRARGERPLEVPAFAPVIRGNRLRLRRTVARNLGAALRGPDLPALCARLREVEPDLLLSDLEPFASAAAELEGVPTLSFGRQQVLTHTRYRLPPRQRAAAPLARAAVRMLSPQRPRRVLVNALFAAAPRSGTPVTLLPPLLRPEVRRRSARRGDHVLVYFNGALPLERLEARLAAVDARFVLYGADPGAPGGAPNVTREAPSTAGFLDDLASCRAVVASAGFNLMSEALHFGKPLLALPNAGNLEQQLNALRLERSGRGARLSVRDLLNVDAARLERFLERPVGCRSLPSSRGGGARRTAEAIERELGPAPGRARRRARRTARGGAGAERRPSTP